MKCIANILTNKPFEDSELYNVTGDLDSLIEGVPTLIVGWEYTKKARPDANILTWEIDKDTYWTFGKRERRNRYEDCVKKFRELAIKRFIDSVKYRYINLLTADEEEKRAYMAMIRGGKTMDVYIYNDMVYVYDDGYGHSGLRSAYPYGKEREEEALKLPRKEKAVENHEIDVH